ncbi:uncharacterized protein ACNS7B_002751 [Menidia menidia]
MEAENLDPLSVEEQRGTEEAAGGAGGSCGAGGAGESWESPVPVKVLRAHRVTAARLCCGERRVLTCSSDSTAVLWDVESLQPLVTFQGVHSGVISEGCVIPESNRLVTVSWDKKMVSWDLETGRSLWEETPAGLLTSCDSSPDGRLLVCSSEPGGDVLLCDAATGRTLQRLSGLHRSSVTRCRFDLQQQRVASASRSIKLWDLRAQKATVSLDSDQAGVVSDLCFSSDGRLLASASWDRTLKLWDLQAGGFRSQGAASLRRHQGSASCCRLAADGSLLVSGSYDRTVVLWDLNSLGPLLVLKGHGDWVTDVALSADRKLLVSSCKDGSVLFWDISDLDQIPEVVQRTEGLPTLKLQCEECGRLFPVCQRPTSDLVTSDLVTSDLVTSDLVTRCVFCRLQTPRRYRPQPPAAM